MKFPCIQCAKTVRRNQHAVQCDKCNAWQHRTCDTGISVADYRAAVHGEKELNFTCKQCSSNINNTVNLEIIHDNSDISNVTSPDDNDAATEATTNNEDTAENRRHSFRPDTSIEEPIQIHERSLDNEPLPTEIIPEEPLTFEIIEKGSQKGSSLLVDSAGYSFTVKERKGNRVRWTCSVRNTTTKCPAAVSQIGNVFKPGERKHLHAPDPMRGFTAKVSRRLHHDSLPDDFWRDDIEVEGRRHLLFSTSKQLDVLRRSSRWYIDGTFKCMRAPFMMLLTIHSFIRRADCTKQVPLMFAVMSGKSISDYVAVFQSIQRMLGNHNVQGMVIDYETAIWRAVRQVFDEIRISGCSFHWGQAVFRKVKKLGLSTMYSRDNATHSYIRQLLCLPFLPKEHIKPTFEYLVNFNTCPAITPLLDYMNKTWFESTVWSVEEWCLFGQSIRTNNDVEGWHRRLNAKTGAGPAFYNLIRMLHSEAKEVEEQMQLVSELALRRSQREKYRTMQREVFEAWDAYSNGHLSASGLLKKISLFYDPRTDDAVETD